MLGALLKAALADRKSLEDQNEEVRSNLAAERRRRLALDTEIAKYKATGLFVNDRTAPTTSTRHTYYNDVKADESPAIKRAAAACAFRTPTNQEEVLVVAALEIQHKELQRTTKVISTLEAYPQNRIGHDHPAESAPGLPAVSLRAGTRANIKQRVRLEHVGSADQETVAPPQPMIGRFDSVVGGPRERLRINMPPCDSSEDSDQVKLWKCIHRSSRKAAENTLLAVQAQFKRVMETKSNVIADLQAKLKTAERRCLAFQSKIDKMNKEVRSVEENTAPVTLVMCSGSTNVNAVDRAVIKRSTAQGALRTRRKNGRSGQFDSTRADSWTRISPSWTASGRAPFQYTSSRFRRRRRGAETMPVPREPQNGGQCLPCVPSSVEKERLRFVPC